MPNSQDLPFWSLVTSNRAGLQGQEEGHTIGKKVKLSLLAEDGIMYLRHPKTSTRKLVETISHFIKVLGYKINPQKAIVFFLYYQQTPRKNDYEQISIYNGIKYNEIL